ncbi:MAG: hypothetical protein ACTTJS_00160 [Wolinella sp.]
MTTTQEKLNALVQEMIDAIEVSNGNWIKSWGGEYSLPKNLVTNYAR